MIEVTDNKSFVATKIISVTNEQGAEIQIATLYGAVELDKSTSYSFTILDKDLYVANREAVQAQVDLFIKEIKDKIAELGGLQF